MRARGSLACAVAMALAILSGGSARGDDAVAVGIAIGPYTTSIGDTSAEVRFELASPARAEVELRPQAAGAKASTLVDGAPTAMHVLRADHLTPATAYAYVVRVGSRAAGEGRFTTSPAAGSHTPVHFIAYGDDRSSPEAHADVVRAMGQVPSDFLVNTGDMVADGGSADDWRSFFGTEAPLLRERPLLVAIGNHELRDDQTGSSFARYFGFSDGAAPPRLYGTVRAGIVRLFFLNAWHDWHAGEERDWLSHALGASDAEPDLVWRIAVVHQAPWSVGPHGPNRELVEAGVPELLAAHRVDLLLGGHDHIYDRGDAGRIKYIVTGGGGAPLYPIDRQDPTSRKAESAYHFVEITASDDALRIVAHRTDGSLIERCGLPKGAGWDCDPPPPVVDVALAPPPPAPIPSAKAPSRCGCSVVGGPAEPPLPLGAALCGALVGVRWGRRERATGSAVERSRPCRYLRAMPSRLARSVWIRLLWIALAIGPASCSGYSGSLTRGQRAFEQGEHDRALAIFRDLEPDLERLSRGERTRYAYLRGMTDYRLGDKADARHWLALAQAMEKDAPGGLEADWTARMNESLGELNEAVYAAVEATVADAPAPPPAVDAGKP